VEPATFSGDCRETSSGSLLELTSLAKCRKYQVAPAEYVGLWIVFSNAYYPM